jgi:hypothetical protein
MSGSGCQICPGPHLWLRLLARLAALGGHSTFWIGVAVFAALGGCREKVEHDGSW